MSSKAIRRCVRRPSFEPPTSSADEPASEIRPAKRAPFDPDDLGLHRHAAYLTASEVVFVFEAPEVEWIVNDIIDDPVLSSAFGPWHAIVEEPPRLAHERYYWSRAEMETGVGLGL